MTIDEYLPHIAASLRAIDRRLQVIEAAALPRDGASAPLRLKRRCPSSIMRIIETTARHTDVPVPVIRGTSKQRDIVRARNVAMFVAYETLPEWVSLPLVGQALGGFHHTTVLTAVRKLRALMEHDEETRALVARIIEECQEPREGCSDARHH